jgi:hypothetical protein
LSTIVNRIGGDARASASMGKHMAITAAGPIQYVGASMGLWQALTGTALATRTEDDSCLHDDVGTMNYFWVERSVRHDCPAFR